MICILCVDRDFSSHCIFICKLAFNDQVFRQSNVIQCCGNPCTIGAQCVYKRFCIVNDRCSGYDVCFHCHHLVNTCNDARIIRNCSFHQFLCCKVYIAFDRCFTYTETGCFYIDVTNKGSTLQF